MRCFTKLFWPVTWEGTKSIQFRFGNLGISAISMYIYLYIYIYLYKQIYVWILYMNSPCIWKLSLYHNVWKLPFFFRNTRISWSTLGGFWWMALALEGWWLDQFCPSSKLSRVFLKLMFSEYVRLRGARWQTLSICRSISYQLFTSSIVWPTCLTLIFLLNTWQCKPTSLARILELPCHEVGAAEGT